LIGLRESQPNTPRPFFLPFANVISLTAFYICNLLIFWTGWDTVSRMMIALSAGLIFFAWYCYRQKNNLWKQEWKGAWWILPYFSILSLFSYLGSFGNGKNILTFGWDFFWIGILTCVIFCAFKKPKKGNL
jgi:hypothetical protein